MIIAFCILLTQHDKIPAESLIFVKLFNRLIFCTNIEPNHFHGIWAQCWSNWEKWRVIVFVEPYLNTEHAYVVRSEFGTRNENQNIPFLRGDVARLIKLGAVIVVQEVHTMRNNGLESRSGKLSSWIIGWPLRGALAIQREQAYWAWLLRWSLVSAHLHIIANQWRGFPLNNKWPSTTNRVTSSPWFGNLDQSYRDWCARSDSLRWYFRPTIILLISTGAS